MGDPTKGDLTAKRLSPGQRFFKRGLDMTFAVVFLISVFPVVFIVLLLAKRVSGDRTPMFFAQYRNGKDGKPFRCYKFCTMRPAPNAHMVHAKVHDERITRIGNLLRMTSVDEFPQLYNVLRGDMSVVGPRPHMLRHTAQYSVQIPYYMERFKVLPGVTGYAQMQGLTGPTPELEQMERRVQADIEYINHYSLWLDVKLICITAGRGFGGVIKLLLGKHDDSE